MITGEFTHVNDWALHSNPLGVMCQHFFRCGAARVVLLYLLKPLRGNWMTEFFQGMGTLCPRWLPGPLLSEEESRLAAGHR
jgi:hypothetical protein